MVAVCFDGGAQGGGHGGGGGKAGWDGGGGKEWEAECVARVKRRIGHPTVSPSNASRVSGFLAKTWEPVRIGGKGGDGADGGDQPEGFDTVYTGLGRGGSVDDGCVQDLLRRTGVGRGVGRGMSAVSGLGALGALGALVGSIDEEGQQDGNAIVGGRSNAVDLGNGNGNSDGMSGGMGGGMDGSMGGDCTGDRTDDDTDDGMGDEMGMGGGKGGDGMGGGSATRAAGGGRTGAWIAGFDFDNCVANTSLYDIGPHAWSMLFPHVPQVMRALHDAGYEVVIFTNESSIGNTRKMDSCRKAIRKKTTRLDEWCEVVNALGVPVDVYISGAERGGASRKPRSGMWDVMKAVRRDRGMSPVDAGNSFFVGDAAGRRGREGRRDDHSDADIGFARNAGVAFHTESSFFKTRPHREEDYTTSEYRSTARVVAAVLARQAPTSATAMLAAAGGGGGGGDGEEATDSD